MSRYAPAPVAIGEHRNAYGFPCPGDQTMTDRPATDADVRCHVWSGSPSPMAGFSIDTLIDGYAFIYGTHTVFDRARARIIGLGELRCVAGKSLVRMWLEHPDLSVVLPEHVGFDPTGINRTPSTPRTVTDDALSPKEFAHLRRISDVVHDACGRDYYALAPDDTAHLVEETLFQIRWMLRHGAGPVVLPGIGTLEGIDNPDGRGLIGVVFSADASLMDQVTE